jgi:hypothetical protein
MIGFGILIELNSFDLGSTLASRLCDTVPPVHHSPISRQDDWIRQVGFVNQL